MTASDKPRVAIVVLNWNGASDTINCVGSLLMLNLSEFEVVICDNDSRAADINLLDEWVKKGSGRVKLLRTGGNLGFAGGVNVGLEYAFDSQGADYVWILNNDTEVEPNALSELLNRVSVDAKIGICGSTLIYHHDRSLVQALGGAAYNPWRARSAAIGAFTSSTEIPNDPGEVERRMSYVVGASMLVSRKFYKKVGPMDPSYFLYSEEHDWAYKGKRLGFELGYAPKSIVYHKHGATIGTSASGGSELSLYYLYRNKLVFSWRHYPLLTPFSLPSLVFEGVKFLLKGKSGKAFAVFRGLLAAPRMLPYKRHQS